VQNRPAKAAIAAALFGAVLTYASPAYALTVPSAPRQVTGTAGVAVGMVRLRWSSPSNTGGGVATYLYEVATDYNAGSGAATWSPLVNLNSSRHVALLACAAMYPAVCTYRVFARNGAGTSAASSPFTVQWSIPSPARRLRVTSANFSDASLTWTAPVNSGGLPVRYDVQVSNDASTTWTTVVSDVTSPAASAPGSCTNGFSCRYRVWAKNDAGSAAQSSSTAVVAVTPGFVGSLASSMTADDVTVGTVTSGQATMQISWAAAKTGLHDGPDQLQACGGVCTSIAFSWSPTVSVPNGVLTSTVTCPADIGCSFRVRATNNRGGAGVWSYNVYKPTAPTNVSAAMGATSGTVAVTFTGPSNPGPTISTAHYTFVVCEAGCDMPGNWTTSATTLPYSPVSTPYTTDVACPTSGASCTVRVQLVNDSGRVSMASSDVTATAA
jgi:hypothetical protein